MSLFSQDPQGQQNTAAIPPGDAFSFHLGPYLPKNFQEVDDILRAYGFRYALERNPGSYWELGVSLSNSAGNEYQDFSLSMRRDIPMADMAAFAVFGANVHRLTTAKATDSGVEEKDGIYYGGHVGGGLLGHVSGNTFLRLELRFNLHPGTTLFFGFGLEFRLGGGDAAAGAGQN